MENNKVINGNCWVAYFDILGFKNDVEHFPPEGVLERYIEILKEIKRYDVKDNFFSDSFMFYTEDDSETSFRRIDAALKLFFYNMFIRHIPMRGCLDVGQIYVNEKKRIFFGRSFIKAYHLAESQNWIGFVLSEKVRERIYDFKAENSDLYRDELKKHYLEYQVPCRKKIKYVFNIIREKEIRERSLLVFNLTINPCQAEQEAEKSQRRLWKSLDTMESIARIHLNEEIKRGRIAGLKKHFEEKVLVFKY